MNIRHAGSGDFQAMLELNTEFEAMLSPLTPARLQQLHEQAALHLAIDHDDALAGFMLVFREGAGYDSVNYRWFAARYDRFLYVDRIVIGRSLQGQGLGRQLYQRVFDTARQADVNHVTCEFYIEPPNPASARFHARQGFEEVGRQAVADGTKVVSLQAADVEPQP